MPDDIEVNPQRLARERGRAGLFLTWPRVLSSVGALLFGAFIVGGWMWKFSQNQELMLNYMSHSYDARDAADVWREFERMNNFKIVIPDVMKIYRDNHLSKK